MQGAGPASRNRTILGVPCPCLSRGWRDRAGVFIPRNEQYRHPKPLPFPRRPLGIDFHHALNSGNIMAAPRPGRGPAFSEEVSCMISRKRSRKYLLPQNLSACPSQTALETLSYRNLATVPLRAEHCRYAFRSRRTRTATPNTAEGGPKLIADARSPHHAEGICKRSPTRRHYQ